MVAVADLERFLERVFERTSARLFRSRIQAVQVERRVERAMEAGRTGRGASTTVPSRYRVRLHPADLDDLAQRSGGFEALAVRLADRALAFARLHAYHLAARPMVSVVADPSVERGRVEVDAGEGVIRSTSAPSGPPVAGAPAGERPPVVAAQVPDASPPMDDPALAAAALAVAPAPSDGSPDGASPPILPSPADPSPGVPAPAPSRAALLPGPDVTQDPEAGPRPSAGPPAPETPSALEHGLRVGDRPYAVRPAPPPPSRALLRVLESGGREREMRVEAQPLTLGRAPDNALVIADARVSRHHGRFQARHGTLVYTDLGSTNGTRVNGIRVDEIVLGPGDRLQIGDVVLVVEQLPR